MHTWGVWWHKAGSAPYRRTDNCILWSWLCHQCSCRPGACGWRWSETHFRDNGLERTPHSSLWFPASDSSERRAGRDSKRPSAPGQGHGAHTPDTGEGRSTNVREEKRGRMLNYISCIYVWARIPAWLDAQLHIWHSTCSTRTHTQRRRGPSARRQHAL